MNATASKNFALLGRVRRRIMAADGTCVFDSGFGKNVIQDKFFANLGAGSPFSIATMITGSAAAGITPSATNMTAGTLSTNTLRVDSTPTTVSQSGTTVTASAGLFTAGMVGRLLVFGASGSGTNPCYITAFTDSTHVTVSTTATVGAAVCSIYTVSGWALTGTTNSSSVIPTTAGNNGTSFAAGVMTYTVTRQWAVQGSPITYLQIALKDTGGNIIAGYQIPGAGDTVGAGFFYVVTWQFAMTISPNVPTVVGNIGSGLNTAGNAMIETVDWFSTISAASVPGGTPVFDGQPSAVVAANGAGWLAAGTWTQNANTAAAGGAPVISAATGYTVSTLTEANTNPANTGTAVNSIQAVFNTTGNGTTINGIALVMTAASRKPMFDVLFTTPYVSPGSGTFTFTFTVTFTIGRTVIN